MSDDFHCLKCGAPLTADARDGVSPKCLLEQEEPVRRRVALKVTTLGMDTKEVIARFEADGNTMSVLPNRLVSGPLAPGASRPRSGGFASRPAIFRKPTRGST